MEWLFAIIAVALAVALGVVYKRYVDARTAAAVASTQIAEISAASEQLRAELDRSRTALDEARQEAASLGAMLEAGNSRNDELKADNVRMTERLEQARSELTESRQKCAALTTQLELLEKRFDEMQQVAEERFRNIATEILNQNSSIIKKQNEERLGEILSPLNEQIQSFKKRVEDIYNEESREFFSLKERLKDLREVGEMMGREAKELSGALRGNNGVQGQWGEMVLETILEQSGLRRGFEYEVQVTRDADGQILTNEEGNQMRPDVIVRYPDNRCVVIDSKASMTSYLEYVNTTDEKRQQSAGREHVNSVRRHAEKLAAKRYDEVLGDSSLDFVMMFIPSEAAYIAAMRLEPTLWQTAYNKRVLIVSPSHLVSALKIIEQLWRRERQTANVVRIAEEAGKMYDKFVLFVTELQKIDKSLDSTRKAYDEAMKKLSTGAGNLVGRAEKLRELGVKTSKSLPKGLLDSLADGDDNSDEQPLLK